MVAAILTALDTTGTPIDVRKVNSATAKGTGAAGDTWGPA